MAEFAKFTDAGSMQSVAINPLLVMSFRPNVPHGTSLHLEAGHTVLVTAVFADAVIELNRALKA